MRRFSYTPEQAAFADEVCTWLAEHFVGEFRDIARRSGDEAWDLYLAWEKELAVGRWIGLTWPEKYGGRGATPTQNLVFQIEYARAGAPIRAGQLGDSPVGPTLLMFGTEEQKRRFLPAMARAEEVWCQGYSEPDAGSDLAGVRTRARREGDEWVINGQKIWTTNADRANWCFVLARTDPDAAPHRGLSYLLCPMDQMGIEVRRIDTMTMNGQFDLGAVFFDGARTPGSNTVGAPGEGWRVAVGTLGHERTTGLLGYEFALDTDFDVLVARCRQTGASSNPVTRDRLVRSYVELRLIQRRCEDFVNRLLHDAEVGPEASLAKLAWTEWHQRFAAMAMDITGTAATVLPSGSSNGYELDPLQAAFLESRAGTIWAGTSEIQRNIIAERLLGLPREL